MQAQCAIVGEGFDDGLHMITASVLAGDSVDCMSTWELEADAEAASAEFFTPDVITEGESEGGATHPEPDLRTGAKQGAWVPPYPLLGMAVAGAHTPSDMDQSSVTANTPPPSVHARLPSAPDTPPPSPEKMLKVGKHSGPGKQPVSRKHWTPEEEALFLKALDKFGPKEIETDPTTGRVSVRLGPGVADLISMVVSSRSVAQVRSHVQKHYIRKEREAARRGYVSASNAAS
jgi:hypothetical protein|eukprot:Tamp_25416.p1 GENE.Tamp_25416~~Tamp_25416.p1  ORF type:complete len:232 (-),score=30.55 Tamp_25416:248-943(-)